MPAFQVQYGDPASQDRAPTKGAMSVRRRSRGFPIRRLFFCHEWALGIVCGLLLTSCIAILRRREPEPGVAGR